MIKRIALVGLNNLNNMGDQIIAETGQYLVRKQCEELETYFVDISPYDSYCNVHLPIRFKCFNLIKKLEGVAGKRISRPSRWVHYYTQYLAWRIKLYRYYQSQLEDADAVIFSGGAFIKYHTQELNYLVDMITEIADKKGIPVMLSAMGIEGYSETDPRCQMLKKAINRSCVKVITTRDNLTLLNEKYIVNKSIETALVGDPAFYVPEYYQVNRKHSNIVGVGIIRKDIFMNYGINYSEEQTLHLYKSIIEELERRGIDWRLFSNGFTSDYHFGEEVLKSLGMDGRKFLPRPTNTKEFVERISEFDAIIAARLHACITAYSLDIPVVGLVWNEKIQIFGDLVGKSNNYFVSSRFSAQAIVDALEKARNEEYDTVQREKLKSLTVKYIDRFVEIIKQK